MAETVAETARLRLRTWDRDDFEPFVRATNTPAVMRWLGGVWSREKHVEAFERLLTYQRDWDHSFWVVEDRSSGELLGFCGLKRVNSPGAGTLTGTAEVGWRLRESAWGRGIAKEAAIASLDLAFGCFNYDEVVSLTFAGNAASHGLMTRLGMTRRSDLDFDDPGYGPDLNPTIVHAISASDWPDARTAALA